MISIHVDPALVALANGLADDADELAILIDRVVGVSASLTSCDFFRTCKPSDLEQILIDAGAFPSFQSVFDVLAAHGLLGVFAAKDVFLSLLTVLDRAQVLVDAYGVEVVEALSSEPALVDLFDRYPVNLRTAAMRSLLSTRYLIEKGLDGGVEVNVSGHPLVGNRFIDSEGSVSKLLSDDREVSDVKENVKGEVACIHAPNDVLRLNALFVWRKARCNSDLHVAIAMRAAELSAAAGERKNVSDKFSVGTEFYRSLASNQAVETGHTRQSH